MKQIAVFAGGCFWCTEAVFQRIKGVEAVKPGFSGGTIKNPSYKEVITQRTGHAESIHITFNTETVNYVQLLEIFFATHDPTSLNQQGADKGTHYRSAIFYINEEQKQIAENYIKLLEGEKVFEKPIVTELNKFEVFYNAEDYHQNYYNQNTEQSYCSFAISPKLKKLTENFSELIKE